MHVIVIGAGVIGVCSAWYLRQAGFSVTVLERRGAPAQGGQLRQCRRHRAGLRHAVGRAGHAGQVLRTLFQRESPVVFRPSADPAMWRWIGRWLRECQPERYRANKLRMQRLAFYSRDCLHGLREALEIEYEQSRGYLQLFRTQRDLDLAAPALAVLRENRVPHQLVDAAGCRRIEPGLAADTALAGGLHLPEDESGSCPMFVRRLHQHAEAAGVQFRLDTDVARLRPTDSGGLTVELAACARRHARDPAGGPRAGGRRRRQCRAAAPLGLRVPLYPVKELFGHGHGARRS